MGYQEDMAEQDKRDEALLAAALTREALERARDPQGMLYAVFEIDTADSFATYTVEKVTAKTVTVKLVLEDDYQDEILGLGGVFPRHRIEKIVLGQRS